MSKNIFIKYIFSENLILAPCKYDYRSKYEFKNPNKLMPKVKKYPTMYPGGAK